MVITIKPGKGKLFNRSQGKGGHLTKSGKIFKNNLLVTDYTSGQQVSKKLK